MGLTVLTLMDYVCTCTYLLSSTIYLVQLILKYCHKLNIHRTQIKLVPAHILLTSFFTSFLICVHNAWYLYSVNRNVNVITSIRTDFISTTIFIHIIYIYITQSFDPENNLWQRYRTWTLFVNVWINVSWNDRIAYPFAIREDVETRVVYATPFAIIWADMRPWWWRSKRCSKWLVPLAVAMSWT